MCAVEFVADRGSTESFPADEKVGAQLQQEAARRGLFSRVKADSFLLAPAAVITDDQLDRVVEILADSVRTVLG